MSWHLSHTAVLSVASTFQLYHYEVSSDTFATPFPSPAQCCKVCQSVPLCSSSCPLLEGLLSKRHCCRVRLALLQVQSYSSSIPGIFKTPAQAFPSSQHNLSPSSSCSSHLMPNHLPRLLIVTHTLLLDYLPSLSSALALALASLAVLAS